MKKIIALVLAVVLALMLAYCASQVPAPIETPTQAPTTEPTAAPTQEPTTPPTVAPTDAPVTDEPTVPPTQEPITEPAEEESKVEAYQQMLSSKGDYWHWMIMSCTFEDPKEISLEHLFYNGLKLEDRTYSADFTAEEVAFLKDALKDTSWGEEGWGNAHKLPAAKVQDVLQTYLGVSLEDVTIPEKWIYFADTDSYYVVKTDAFSVGNFQVIHVQEYEDGTVEVCWTVDLRYDTMSNEYLENPMMLLTMKQQDGHYITLSNALLPESEK